MRFSVPSNRVYSRLRALSHADTPIQAQTTGAEEAARGVGKG